MNFTITELVFFCSLGVMVMAWIAFVYFQLKKEIKKQAALHGIAKEY